MTRTDLARLFPRPASGGDAGPAAFGQEGPPQSCVIVPGRGKDVSPRRSCWLRVSPDSPSSALHGSSDKIKHKVVIAAGISLFVFFFSSISVTSN